MVTWCQYLKTWTISAYVFLHILKCHEKLAQNPPSDFAVIFFKVRSKFTLGWNALSAEKLPQKLRRTPASDLKFGRDGKKMGDKN